MNKYNKPQKWRRLSSRVVFTHPRIVLAEDEVELPDGKRSSYLRQVYQGKGGVIIICQNGGKVLIQREYSYPVDDILYQFPGGKIEPGEIVVNEILFDPFVGGSEFIELYNRSGRILPVNSLTFAIRKAK